MYKLPLWIFVGTKHISIYFPFERHFKVDDFSFSLSVGSCSFPNLRSPNRQGDGSWGRKRTNAYPGAELSNWTKQIAIIIIDMAW